MPKYLIFLTVLLNCLSYPQSDETVFPADSVAVNNRMEPQTVPSSSIANINLPHWYEPVSNIPSNIYGVIRNSFNSENLPTLGYISALTTVLVLTDAQTHSAVKSFFVNNQPLNRNVKYIVYLGDGRINLGIAGLFAAYGLTFNDDRALRTGIQCTEAILTNGLFVQLLKRITGRESPYTASSKSGTWRFFPNIIKYQKDQPKYYSFPSGHLSTAMATLTVIAENYPESNYIKPVGYSLIGLVGVGLVAKDMHWFSDFPLACALGYEFGKIITSQNISSPQKKESSGSYDISVMPIFLPGGGGINMLLSF